MKLIVIILFLTLSFEIANAQHDPVDNSRGGSQGSAEVPVCVVGSVAKPAIISHEGSITLLQAVRKAGGTLPDMKGSGARVYRQFPGTTTNEVILIDSLRSIERGKVPDLKLLPFDVVEVFNRRQKKVREGTNPCKSWRPVFYRL